MLRMLLIAIVALASLTTQASAVYDPATGRWLTRDPAGYIGGDNLYRYGQSSPVISQDPLGLWEIKYRGSDWTQAEKDAVKSALDGACDRLPEIQKAMNDRMAGESKCVQDAMADDIEELNQLYDNAINNCHSDTKPLTFDKDSIPKGRAAETSEDIQRIWISLGPLDPGRGLPFPIVEIEVELQTRSGSTNFFNALTPGQQKGALMHELIHAAEYALGISDGDKYPSAIRYPYEMEKFPGSKNPGDPLTNLSTAIQDARKCCGE